MNIDLKSDVGLSNEVYAPQVVIDYTSMFGGKPIETTGKEWAESLKSMMSRFDATEHIVTNQAIILPQPAKVISRPDKYTVIAHVAGHTVRRAASVAL
ncbi:hypothetical protein F4818DRAFT_445099 [Hypoxylon cercidicola]|nr:hypothetical protein F4818DRAFT_445099 [Hypoxylon cercidicola]